MLLKVDVKTAAQALVFDWIAVSIQVSLYVIDRGSAFRFGYIYIFFSLFVCS